ncbi:hypothetical protein DPQ33_16435 [Oceanidesulfovibrio indonesiensis]|uniref:Phage tail fibre protein N-terminal domain-containing protein n=1 Tax=Oceanidesulfovibrio indonesiensis TaxID=54767 RepID=A0A7M3MAX7_9BACT|nr:phage tail protein [Oceanidesulfovibrio indonesiensis]TVM15074.1 hypothetical protein DPQ33_16435 [Oceanidesulfovibrio indonesiensis]
MADFQGMVITQQGLQLLAKAQTGVTLEITRAAVGSGEWPDGQDPEAMADLVHEEMSLAIQGMEVQSGGVTRLTVLLTNSGLQQGFFIRELGVYANDPQAGEILYTVAYAGDKYDYVPAAGTPFEKVFDIYIVTANASEVTAQIDPSVMLALKSDFDAHNADPEAHPPLRQACIDTVAAHNEDPDAHQALMESRELTTNTTIYVSLNGDDLHGDGSEQNPFRTHHRAIVHLSRYRVLRAGVATISTPEGGVFEYDQALYVHHPDYIVINLHGSGAGDGSGGTTCLRFTGCNGLEAFSPLYIQGMRIESDAPDYTGLICNRGDFVLGDRYDPARIVEIVGWKVGVSAQNKGGHLAVNGVQVLDFDQIGIRALYGSSVIVRGAPGAVLIDADTVGGTTPEGTIGLLATHLGQMFREHTVTIQHCELPISADAGSQII